MKTAPVHSSWWWLVVAAFVACVTVPVLQPAPGAATVPQQPNVVFADVAGVRVWAGGTWDGEPTELGDVVTPVHVALENQGQRPLRVRYADCRLVGSSGFSYSALPPFPYGYPVSDAEPEGDAVQSFVLAQYHHAAPAHPPGVARPGVPPPGAVRPGMPPPHGMHPYPVYPRHPAVGFYIAPPYYGWYPGLMVWPYPWVWDVHYTTLYGAWPQPLPTRDMLEHALPEGVLKPGGRVAGFLYFQQIAREGAVTLELTLVDAETSLPLGVAKLPFVVVR